VSTRWYHCATVNCGVTKLLLAVVVPLPTNTEKVWEAVPPAPLPQHKRTPYRMDPAPEFGPNAPWLTISPKAEESGLTHVSNVKGGLIEVNGEVCGMSR